MYQQNPVFTKRITFSIEESLRDDLNFLTEELNMNRSSLIRGLLINWMASKKLIFQCAVQEPYSQEMKDAIGYSIAEGCND